MKDIILLTDYKGNFGSKWNAKPYRSGMDQNLIKKYFNEENFNTLFLKFHNAIKINDFSNKIILYTSSEDPEYIYKSYIEDVILNIKLKGALMFPKFEFLRANNNKVSMELLRKNSLNKNLKTIKSIEFGCYEEYLEYIKEEKISFPLVYKESEGAMSKGVFLAKDKNELEKIIKNSSSNKYRLKNYTTRLKDIYRSKKHPNYVKDSIYRKKFILQEFIPNLNFDLKVLIFGSKIYICKRPTKKGDFRASGSGADRYLFGSKVDIPKGLFDFVDQIRNEFDTPNLSVDIAYDGVSFHLIEFQAIYFGTSIIVKSDGFYKKTNDKYVFSKDKVDVEKVYVDSIIEYLNKK
jgi:glutathione synthase/RimK-type ligase-like ATP-grasp enzyme